MSDEEEDQGRDERQAHVGHRGGYSEEIEDLEEQATEDLGIEEFGSEGFRTVGRERQATETAALVAETSEGAQELLPRSTTGSGVLRR